VRRRRYDNPLEMIMLSRTTTAPVKTMGQRVKRDDRGTASFDWEIATGVLRKVSKDTLIDALAAPDLALADDLQLIRATRTGGYDPYNRGR
jgi:hypothetical protein